MPADEYPEGNGSGIDSEAVFVMDPQAVVWQLARMLISGQHTVVSMRRAAEAARQSASVAPEKPRSSSPITNASKPVGTTKHCPA